MQGVILAGGKGTRLQPLTNSVPKLLIEINNEPLIAHLLRHLKQNGCNDIIICTGHLGDKISHHLETNSYDMTIHQSRETKPLGTGGALESIKNSLEDDFFILYGDVYTSIDLKKMHEFHKKKNAAITAVIHPTSHPEDSDLVELDSNFRITRILKKPNNQIPINPHSLAAIYIGNSQIKNFLNIDTPFDIAHDLLPKLLDENIPVFGYNTSELIMDIGTHERLKKAQKLLKT
ncbi:MAG: NDP-sugar synthase [Candidatus Levybacteria bacterium]|nr:NDP-sugar synthase [Candidatus Levybacteria bacterium]